MTDIGGWSLVDVGEAFMCSSRLTDGEWKVAFKGEDVQFGLAPQSLKEHVKQRMRWVFSVRSRKHLEVN